MVLSRFQQLLFLGLVTMGLASCGRSVQADKEQQRQAMPVQVKVLEAKPTGNFTEYVATLKSRDSIDLNPEVEGQITRILVRSGERVKAGEPLFVIDPLRQEATVVSTEAQRKALQADLEYKRLDYERKSKLAAEGVISRQEVDLARSAYESAQANVDSTAANIRQQQVQLRYFRVTAPSGGTVGDIPVREGDRVTQSTLLTTIDRGGPLEAYISVPAFKGADISNGMPVQIIGPEGKVVVESKVDFISPRVEEATQLLLVKAPVPNRNGQFRNNQTVRVRTIWSQEPRVQVPSSAVTRLAGRTFAFVTAERDGHTVAQQRPIELGELAGNSYVVESGLKSGDKLITSGVQMLADGMPVQPMPSQPAASQPAREQPK